MAKKNNNMPVNWLEILEHQRDNAREVAASTIRLFSQSDFTQEEVSRIYEGAENYAREFAHIMQNLNEHDLDEVLMEMAKGIAAMWDTILAAIARHLDGP